MRTILILVIFLLLTTSTLAVSLPQMYNGKEYYTVTSTDPSEDTGAEVCAKIGSTCLGYTEESTAVCKLFNPGAATSSSASGDLSSIYCDGPPQKNICAGKTNTCHECPACTATVDCNTPIGGLYREMYVECAPVATSCPVTMYARTTQQLLNEIPSLHTQLQSCPVTLPSGTGMLISTGNIVVDILMNSGKTESVTVTVKSKMITGVQRGSNACVQRITTSEKDIDAILSSKNRAAAIMNAYASKKITVKGCTFIKRIITGITGPISRFFVGRSAPPATPPTPPSNCGNLGEQCNNRGCKSGVCAAPYEFRSGRWMPVNYQCIAPGPDYDAKCIASGGTRAPWDCIAYPCR